MLEFGKDYAEQILKNSKSLGEALSECGLPVLKTDQFGITQSHQILLPFNTEEGLSFKRKLEKVGIFVDAFVRIGTAEISRRGLKEGHMKDIAEFISDVVIEDKDPEVVKNRY